MDSDKKGGMGRNVKYILFIANIYSRCNWQWNSSVLNSNSQKHNNMQISSIHEWNLIKEKSLPK